MPYSNYTESLLDLKDVIVTNIRTDGRVRLIWLEQKRMTGRMQQYIISRFSQSRSAQSIASECGCSAYFNQFDKGQKNTVQYVVMDMSGEFRSMAKTVFPKANIVADKFHVCRQVTWAFERTRIKAQKEFGPERRKYFKRSRWIMLKRKKNLTEEEKQQLDTYIKRRKIF